MTIQANPDLGAGHVCEKMVLRSCVAAVCVTLMATVFLRAREVRIVARTSRMLSMFYVGIPVSTSSVLRFVQMPSTQRFWSFLTNMEACLFACATFELLEWAHIATRAFDSVNLPQCVESDPETIAWYHLWTRFQT